jgi:uncharacterized membrane protein YkvA (DUF1232 family)
LSPAKKLFARLRSKSKQLRTEAYALYLAYRDPRVSWFAKLVSLLVVSYAFSPIDLIPDFIPVLGYLDDLIVIPIGVALAIRLIPPDVMVEARSKAAEAANNKGPSSRFIAFLIIAFWLICAWLGIRLIAHRIESG